MKITKRQLKRIIREEYSRVLKEGGWEMDDEMMDAQDEIVDLASREQGLSLAEVDQMFGPMGMDIVWQAEENGLVWGDAERNIVYGSGGHELSAGPRGTRSSMGGDPYK